MRPPQNVNSSVPVVTAPQLSVRLIPMNRSVPVEDAVWNAAEPLMNRPHVNRAVPAATVSCSVRVRQRPASNFVQ